MAKISVAMTTYNGEKFVLRQLQSLLAQTRPPDEVVILDDRSADGTPNIVQSFIEQNRFVNWRFSVNGQNLGFIRNFGEAIKLTSGELIVFCDQDDVWYPEKLEIMERLFAEHPDMQALNTSFDFIDGDGKSIYTKDSRGRGNHGLLHQKAVSGELKKLSFPDLMGGNISPGCTMMCTRETAAAYLTNTDRELPHDWEINLCAALAGGLYFYNRPLVGYRIHGDNAIGLATAPEKWQMTGTASSRQKVLRAHEQIIKLSEDPRVTAALTRRQKRTLAKFKNFVKMRRRCLEKHSIFTWLRIWGLYIPLRLNKSVPFPDVRLRTLGGDLVTIIKKEK